MILKIPNVKKAIVGFSGGSDSTALLHWVHHNTDCDITAVHINHGIHSNSNAWENHCEKFCYKYGIRFEAKRVEFDKTRNVEANARKARYSEFSKLGIQDILLAHHAADQWETFFLKLLRGCGVAGLASLRPKRTIDGLNLIRPMLRLSKKDVLNYVNANKLSYVDDPSNFTDSCDRNKLRLNIFPEILSRFPEFPKAFEASVFALQDAEVNLQDLAEIDLSFIMVDNRISIERIRSRLNPRRLRNVIHHYMMKNELNIKSRELLGFSEQIFHVTGHNKIEIVGRGYDGKIKKLKQRGMYLELDR